MTYTVVVKGAPPQDLARKIAVAHAEAVARRSASGFGGRSNNKKAVTGRLFCAPC